MTEMTKGTKQYLKEVFGMDNLESMPVSMFKTVAENIQDGKDCGYSTQADEELQELLFEYVIQHTPARMRMPIHVINRLVELIGAYGSGNSDFYAKMHGGRTAGSGSTLSFPRGVRAMTDFAVGTRVQTTKAPVWAVRSDDRGTHALEVPVPIGACGTVVEIAASLHGRDPIVRWDDPTLGESLFNDLLAVCTVLPSKESHDD